MVGVSASVNLPLHHKVQKFSSGIGSPVWSQKRAVKRLCVCVSRQIMTPAPHHLVLYRPDAIPDAQATVSKH